jgi:hypothetical protein
MFSNAKRQPGLSASRASKLAEPVDVASRQSERTPLAEGLLPGAAPEAGFNWASIPNSPPGKTKHGTPARDHDETGADRRGEGEGELLRMARSQLDFLASIPNDPPPRSGSGSRVAISSPDDSLETEADRVAEEALQLLPEAAGTARPRSFAGVRPPRITRGAPIHAQRQADVASEPVGGGLIVDDDVTELTSGQIRKSELLAEIRAEACTAADQVLASAGRDTRGCPYVEQALAYYSGRDASQVERAIR